MLDVGCGGCGQGGDNRTPVGHLDSFRVGPSSGSGYDCGAWQKLGRVDRVLWEVRS